MSNEFKLVPVEPDREMCLAAKRERDSYPIVGDRDSPVVMWRAMLAAAPRPPELGGEPEVLAITCRDHTFKWATDDWRHIPANIQLIDRARLAPLQAENAQLRILSADQALNLKRVKRDYVELKAVHDQLEARCDELEGAERQFVGMVKLEWTQHRQLFDRIVDPNNRGYSYYTNYIEVNHRDDGTEVLRDTQWVGLFAAKVQTTCTIKGYAHGNQPQYEYSEYEPSLIAENNTAKITSRRSGELDKCYKDLDKMLSVLSYNYDDRPKGRRDCPQRVHSKFAKQEITGYNETRKAAKDLTRDHLTATVYEEAKYGGESK
ncbi:hypothetical protein PHB09_134 [Pseudomonas phage PHB09]|uniref:Uncharacterized protein n=1 Tax=Pseudomonas phage PHB09 TaxID=2867265 RepID=A0AAE9BN28_9CAUD|nr:hypothetical protein QGX10_gp133 [Pseudomonas phage PHB09]UAV84629.1 hypothetical protein PHB09_134 [Pseudomonas phage PHB09]